MGVARRGIRQRDEAIDLGWLLLGHGPTVSVERSTALT